MRKKKKNSLESRFKDINCSRDLSLSKLSKLQDSVQCLVQRMEGGWGGEKLEGVKVKGNLFKTDMIKIQSEKLDFCLDENLV